MDNKVILLLEEMNDMLKRIYDLLKTTNCNTIRNNNIAKENENKDIELLEKEDKDDILTNWESKMPLNEVMDKLYPYSKYKKK
ncbi:hypothetical protein [Anaerophilus nitritogenes]|uniref:hypothetical protein n=1 Tax=Anaerophilus nitritogenes TaxID=2498136 RepID=UPI00101DFA73|nr:hypothetical protein [Anaerophilus nitritogenes]